MVTDERRSTKGQEQRVVSWATTSRTQTPAWLLDLLLGGVVAVVIAVAISADLGGRQDPDLTAYAFAGGFGGVMLIRRRFPVAVLMATMLLLFAYYTLGYPMIGLAVPVAAALYSAAELGHLTAAIVVSLLLLAVSTYFRLLDGETVAYLFGYELISSGTLMAAAIALGDNTRARRNLQAEQAQTARLIAQEHTYRAEQQIQEERLRMARDLHDVIGHSISVISLHADVAQEAIGDNQDQARQALRHIRTTASQTLRELRSTVKILRNPEEPNRSVASLANLSSLIDSAATSGLKLDVHIQGDPATLPTTVDTAVYRIVQEALTNVIRHARATQVVLTLAIEEDRLHLRLVDNGSATTTSVRPGNGIAGMTERARLLGGALTARPLPAGGFEVQAELPLEKRP